MKKDLYSFLFFIFNFINIPLKEGFKKLKKWYLDVEKEDNILWFAFAPFYWIVAGLVYFIGLSSDKLEKIVNK